MGEGQFRFHIRAVARVKDVYIYSRLWYYRRCMSQLLIEVGHIEGTIRNLAGQNYSLYST